MKLRLLALVLPVGLVVALGGSAADARTSADTLLSQGRPVIASSNEDDTLAAAKAIDGDSSTRWASTEGSDPQWLRVDLGQPAAVGRVKLNWEAAYAKAYRIEVSDDGTSFTTVKEVANGNGATDDLTGLNAHGRYLRLVGTQRATSYGYSLWELEVYGTKDSSGDTQAPTVPTGLKSTGATATSVALTWTASTDNVGVSAYEVLRDGKVIASTASTQYNDTGLTANTAYQYSVRARDLAGNTSAAAAPIAVTTGTGGTGGFVLAAAGDIADRCTASDSKCVHPKTAKLVQAMNPSAVITMGDNQYDDAHLSDFQKYYATTWGKFKNITHPIPGNHETYDNTPYEGYHKYFGSIATPQGKNYYSWEMGNWHFIALDSNDFVKEEGLAEPAQLTWLRQDLAKNTKGCIAAYYHHPRFSSGDHGDNPDADPLWKTLVSAKTDLILNGHDHHYERFLPQNAAGAKDPNGPVQIIGGMGGAPLYPVSAAHPATAKIVEDFGVLKLSMTDTTFSTQLIGLDSKVLDSSPTYTCH
ncbi:discoidin domain-containing protein [Kribbella solani]|uniref:discoidin domain-containing protein n=1 Tax=Kribbella solani TaxID=236067 RepID=UPI0029BE69D0|nr:discoidin domain-containing protein [Kribbella solani]MDX2971747.1 discoidin domain-containing protein [Kribbella solani]